MASQTLQLQYRYELIPDTPASRSAGYTDLDRSQAQVFYSPITDQKYFYYVAWTGSALFMPHKSGILVCRKRKNGQLVYAVNCQDFSLDSSANFLGDTAIIPRIRPALYKDTLYLTNDTMTNLGPQLYAVNKATGKLIWASAYYPPKHRYITKKGDYSRYRGSNMRLGDLCPIVQRIGKRTLIFVGSSSAQNAINVGTLAGQFPTYTDQGYLFCIEDLGYKSRLIWRVPTCAPLLKPGDLLLQNGPAEKDPFIPGQDHVIFTSVTAEDNYFIQPYYLINPPAPGTPNTVPIVSIVQFDHNTDINMNLVQPIWCQILSIYQDQDRTQSYNLSQLVEQWRTEQSQLQPGQTITHNIWSYVDHQIIKIAKEQVGNTNILYFKQLYSGQRVGSQDAQGLNYYGNGVWGAKPTIKDGVIYFGTGQAHNLPLSESLFYNQTKYNFLKLKTPVIDLTYQYLEHQVSLKQLNRAKTKFTDRIRDLALADHLKSPRGRLSYSDAMIGVRIADGKMIFGIRTVPCDFYSFLNSGQMIVYPLNVLDGDASSGIVLYRNKIATSTKAGITVIYDFSNGKYKLIYSGPNSTNGGSNYQLGSTGRYLVSSQANMPVGNGATSSAGLSELMITDDGQLIKPNNSFVQAIDLKRERVLWSTDYGQKIATSAISQVVVHDGLIYVADLSGGLYLFSLDGQIRWRYDGRTVGMNGGINAPWITEDGQVFWTNNYQITGLGSSGPNGVCFKW